MIIEQIKKDQLNARIQRDQLRTSLLTTVIGEADTIAKNKKVDLLSDADTITLIHKFVKNLDIVLEHGNDQAKLMAETERDILATYLPQMLTDDELKGIISTLRDTEGTDLSLTMSYLKQNFSGRYDGKKASQFYKEI